MSTTIFFHLLLGYWYLPAVRATHMLMWREKNGAFSSFPFFFFVFFLLIRNAMSIKYCNQPHKFVYRYQISIIEFVFSDCSWWFFLWSRIATLIVFYFTHFASPAIHSWMDLFPSYSFFVQLIRSTIFLCVVSVWSCKIMRNYYKTISVQFTMTNRNYHDALISIQTHTHTHTYTI